MWHLIPAILYLSCVQGYLQQRQPNNPYSAVITNNDRTKLAPYSYYPGQPAAQAAMQYPEYTNAPHPYNYPGQRQPQYIQDPYYNAPPNNKMGMQDSMYSMNGNNLRQSQSQTKPNLFGAEVLPFALNDSNDPDKDVERNSFSQGQSYFEDLELIENFGNYLKKRTLMDGSSTSLNDAAHQHNALLAVILALAKAVRNSCDDFDQVYDQIYLSTVDTYYKYGLANADKVAGMIEDYIRKGKSHIPKLKKLKQELCEKDLLCSVSVDNKIKASLLSYVKELETLESLSHLARSFYSFIEEFNQAVQKGNVLPYLQNSKDRLREYVMHVVNSIEHVSDKAVRCT